MQYKADNLTTTIMISGEKAPNIFLSSDSRKQLFLAEVLEMAGDLSYLTAINTVIEKL